MPRLYCDVHGTLIGGPHPRDVMLQALQDVSPPYSVQLVSGDVYEANRALFGELYAVRSRSGTVAPPRVADKADVIRTKNLKGCVWIDDEPFLLRALARKGVTAVHVDDALEFLEGIRRHVRENSRRPQRIAVWYEIGRSRS